MIVDVTPPVDDDTQEALAARSDSWHFGLRDGLSAIDLHSDTMDPYRRPVLTDEIWARARRVSQDGVAFLIL